MYGQTPKSMPSWLTSRDQFTGFLPVCDMGFYFGIVGAKGGQSIIVDNLLNLFNFSGGWARRERSIPTSFTRKLQQRREELRGLRIQLIAFRFDIQFLVERAYRVAILNRKGSLLDAKFGLGDLVL